MEEKNILKEAKARFQSLIERMDKSSTYWQGKDIDEKFLNEVSKGADRILNSYEEAANAIDNIKSNTWVTIGVVKGTSIKKTITTCMDNYENVPRAKYDSVGPTGRKSKKLGIDYDSVGEQMGIEKLGGIIDIISYNFRCDGLEAYKKKAGAYHEAMDALKTQYGLSTEKTKLDPLAQDETARANGQDVLTKRNVGDDEEQEHYLRRNVYKPNVKGVYYAIDTEGNILTPDGLTKEQMSIYIRKQAKNYDSEVNALIKLGKTEEEIKKFKEARAAFKWAYRTFKHSEILYICATSANGEHFLWINDNMRCLTGNGITSTIEVNPAQLSNIARKRYQIDSINTDREAEAESDDVATEA